jgi:hypothetical protein
MCYSIKVIIMIQEQLIVFKLINLLVKVKNMVKVIMSQLIKFLIIKGVNMILLQIISPNVNV